MWTYFRIVSHYPRNVKSSHVAYPWTQQKSRTLASATPPGTASERQARHDPGTTSARHSSSRNASAHSSGEGIDVIGSRP